MRGLDSGQQQIPLLGDHGERFEKLSHPAFCPNGRNARDSSSSCWLIRSEPSVRQDAMS
ncbi:hypothetical protein [Streptomyces hainanensis]|uniref:hypothetical protein n=1 Tax=Streptomyces hainanensis TaxID=402648 RepID=UPI0014055294|nr:hypothetical protein [Streptomyces hainanensis]